MQPDVTGCEVSVTGSKTQTRTDKTHSLKGPVGAVPGLRHLGFLLASVTYMYNT